MRTVILTLFLILTFNFPSKANVDCIWTSNGSGLTIRYIAPCDFQTQVFLDSFLKKVVLLLNRQDTNLKVLVLVDNGRLSFSGAAFSNFVSVGYDTLREIDDDYIFNYYWAKESGGSVPLDTRNNPLDINSTKKSATTDVGIKIIYDKDYRLGKPDWDEVSKLIVYAVNNVDKVKEGQRRDTVRYNTNGWYVSLVTLDTNDINRIWERKSSIQTAKAKMEKKSSSRYIIIAALFAIVFLTLLVSRKKNSS